MEVIANDGFVYLSIQVPVQKNECPQAADCDTKLRLDGEGMLEEVLVIGLVRRHEGLDVNVGQRWGSTYGSLVFSFSIKSICVVVELGKCCEGKYEVDGA